MSDKQLYEKKVKDYSKIYPLTYMRNILDENGNNNLIDIFKCYNHIYVTYANNVSSTRLLVPEFLRKYGLWISYEKDGKLYTEAFLGSNVDAKDEYKWTADSNWEYVPDLQYIESASSRIPKQAILPEHLSNSILEMISNAGAKITNLVDEEDLTETECHVIKLKDRKYNKALASGLGYKILRKNWVNGKNILTQDMVNEPNTIYIIQYDYIIDGYITLKENSYVDYKGGSIIIERGSFTYANNIPIDVNVYNPLYKDFKYSNNDIIINKKIPVHKEKTGTLIVQQSDIIANNILDSENIDTTISGYYTTRLLGKDRFSGDIKWKENTLYKTIYASEFIKNKDNSYNITTINDGQKPDLTTIYNKIKNTFINSSTTHYTIIIDFKEAYITDTIKLSSMFSLICPDRCNIYLGNNFNNTNNRKNIFEAVGSKNSQVSIIDGFNVIIRDKYYNNFIKFFGNGWHFNIKNINPAYGLNDNDNKINNYNGIIETNIEAYKTGSQNPNCYNDFLIISNIQGNNRESKYDIILGAGEANLIEYCDNIKVLCLTGQKEFRNCIQTSVYACYANIKIDNCHNEKAKYSFYKCNVIFNECVIGNAIGQNISTITINDENLLDDVHNIYNIDNTLLSAISRVLCNTITLDNVIFSYNDCSEYCGYKRNLYNIEIKQYKDSVYIINNNSYRTNGWLNHNNELDIYTNVDNYDNIIITNPNNTFTLPYITQGESYKSTISNHSDWSTYQSILNYVHSLQNQNYIVKILNVISLYNTKRMLGITTDVNNSFHCNYINNAFFYNDFKKGLYIINFTIDDIPYNIILNILSDNNNVSSDYMSKYMCLGKTYNNGNIICNDCSKIDIIGDNNIRAYLTSIPTYGNWNENDECVVNNIYYKYINEEWVNEVGTTENRPTNIPIGFQYFDTTINKPIWWTGIKWVDSTGNNV